MTTVVCCTACGSTNVCRDAFAKQDPTTGEWELSNLFDYFVCDDCGADTKQPQEMELQK